MQRRHAPADALSAPAVTLAWRRSFLGEIPGNESFGPAMLSGAALLRYGAGEVARPDGEDWYGLRYPLGLVLGGTFRAYLADRNGRQATVQYYRTGDVWGTVALADPATTQRDRLSFQALGPATVLVMNGEHLLEAGRSEPAVGWAVARVVAQTVAVRTEALSLSTFANSVTRLAQQLSELVRETPDGRWFIDASQQQLADACGTVREMVGRAIAQLKSEGIVRYEARRLEVLDLDRLLALGS